MTIGQVAKRAGIRTSAIRYYERIGLVPPPARKSGRRVYGEHDVLHRLAVIAFARSCGFSLRETRSLFTSGRPYSARLREKAQGKLREIDAMIERAHAMKVLLRTALRCNCMDLDQCGRLLTAAPKR